MERKGPNLQNIPIRTPEGRRIRDAFLGPSALDLASDYDEVERRILAGLGVSEESLKGDTNAATADASFKAVRQEAQTRLFRKVYGGEEEP